MQETQAQSLGWEDPLEEEMATHFSMLAWEIPWTEEPGRLQSMGLQRVGHDSVRTHTHTPHDEVCMHDQTKFRLGNLCIQCTESKKEKETRGVAMWPCPHSNTAV